MILRTAINEMFSRDAIGVRAHADGVGVKQSNVSFEAVRGIILPGFEFVEEVQEFLQTVHRPLCNFHKRREAGLHLPHGMFGVRSGRLT